MCIEHARQSGGRERDSNRQIAGWLFGAAGWMWIWIWMRKRSIDSQLKWVSFGLVHFGLENVFCILYLFSSYCCRRTVVVLGGRWHRLRDKVTSILPSSFCVKLNLLNRVWKHFPQQMLSLRKLNVMAEVVKIWKHHRRHKHNAQPCPFSASHFALFSINMKIYYVLLSESNKKKTETHPFYRKFTNHFPFFDLWPGKNCSTRFVIKVNYANDVKNKLKCWNIGNAQGRDIVHVINDHQQ